MAEKQLTYHGINKQILSNIFSGKLLVLLAWFLKYVSGRLWNASYIPFDKCIPWNSHWEFRSQLMECLPDQTPRLILSFCKLFLPWEHQSLFSSDSSDPFFSASLSISRKQTRLTLINFSCCLWKSEKDQSLGRQMAGDQFQFLCTTVGPVLTGRWGLFDFNCDHNNLWTLASQALFRGTTYEPNNAQSAESSCQAAYQTKQGFPGSGLHSCTRKCGVSRPVQSHPCFVTHLFVGFTCAVLAISSWLWWGVNQVISKIQQRINTE